MDCAVVTGGCSGLGAGFVKALEARGAGVFMIDKDFCAGLSGKYGRNCDLTSREELEEICHYLATEDVSILVNCAGVCEFGPFVDSERWEELIDLNCTATVALCRAVLPGMIKRGRGKIINVSSVTTQRRLPGTVVYSATKCFGLAFTEYLATELVGTGVSVQCLLAPAMKTNLWAAAGQPMPTEYVRDVDYVVQMSLANLDQAVVLVE